MNKLSMLNVKLQEIKNEIREEKAIIRESKVKTVDNAPTYQALQKERTKWKSILAVVLRDNGLSLKETAAVMECSTTTVTKLERQRRWDVRHSI